MMQRARPKSCLSHLPSFDHPDPHILELAVRTGDIDAYGHVNNSVYLKWFDKVAWSHSAMLGIPVAECVRLRRGMAAHRTEIDYVLAATLGDVVQAATWIVGTDHRLRVERCFQVLRSPDGTTLVRARTQYVCINLDSGRAARMPEIFSQAYIVTAGSSS
jgi:acyl-CoA thioester hydrolase